MTVDELLARLEGVSKSGSGWHARCPVHDDHSPSLSVSEGDAGGVVLHCHAGCDPKAICHGLGLQLVDLAPPKPGPNGRHREVARYAYQDEDGRHLYDVVRWEPKGFSQAPANGKRGTGAMQGVRRVLYRLPDVLRVARVGGVVWICEGEKDADRLNNLLGDVGAIATTNPGGAGKWRSEYNESLWGAQVVIVADADDAGRQHAHQVEASLCAIAASVHVVEPAVGKDAHDHLTAGCGLGDFRHATAARPQRESRPVTNRSSGVVVVPMSSVRRERVRFLVPETVPIRMLTLLAGDPGLGKSLWSCQLAAEVSRSGRSVVILSAEDSYSAVVRPRLEAAQADLDRIFHLRIRRAGQEDDDGLWIPDDAPALSAAVSEVAAALFIVDPLTAFLPESVNSWRDASVRRALRPLHEIAERHDAAGLILAHLNKAHGHGPLQRVGGSIGLPAAVRSALLLARDPDDPDGDSGTRRVLAHFKSNISLLAESALWEIAPIVLPAADGQPETKTARFEQRGSSPHTGRSLLAAPSDDDARTELEEARAFLLSELGNGSADAKVVIQHARSAGISETTLRRAKKGLGVTSEKGGFGGTGAWAWTLPSNDDHVTTLGALGDGWQPLEDPPNHAGKGALEQSANPLRLSSQKGDHLRSGGVADDSHEENS